MQYVITITSGFKVMAKVKVFKKKVELQGQGQKVLYHVKGLITRNTRVI